MRISLKIRILFLAIVLAVGATLRAEAVTCGEAGCVPAQAAYVSHFSGPGCTGTESYYRPYDNHAYQCRTWDGGGQCGTTPRTISARSYLYNGTCYPDPWPSGNVLNDAVTVYRTTTDPCGEAGCNLSQGTYISHFSGAGCTGTESYYRPYDGYAYQCRTWDGRGQCGTVQRTVTNRSYLQNGTCHEAWPSGNTLGEFVTVYRPADSDGDGIPDALERSLAQQFFPTLNLHCGTYEGLAYGDRRQLYGLTVSGYSNSSNGKIPFVAYPYNPGNGNCSEPHQCIEIRYGIAWNWDLGDDAISSYTDHRGDSETYAILVARKDTNGADWGVTWDVAKNDVNQWRLIKEFMSAHWGETSDSTFRSHGNFGTTMYQKVWAAEGKHAMYPTQNACNNGGVGDADDCSDNRCDINTEVFLKVQNAGQPLAPINPFIPYPGASRTTPPSGIYDVWGGTKFGDSTAYKTHLTQALSWCPSVCY